MMEDASVLKCNFDVYKGLIKVRARDQWQHYYEEEDESNDVQNSKDDSFNVDHIFLNMGIPPPVCQRRPSTDDEDVDED